MSSSPEKLGRSSKSRTKSPCSPQAVGEILADADVLLAAEVVELYADGTGKIVKVGSDDKVCLWLLVKLLMSELERTAGVAVSDVDCRVDEGVGAWPFTNIVPVEYITCELGVTKLELSAVAVSGPLASELPIEDNICVLGVAELKLVLKTLPELLLVMSATSIVLALGEAENEGGSMPDAEELAPELDCGDSPP
jgi:hypothetical protein